MARISRGTTAYGLNSSNREQNAASFLQSDVDDLTDATALVFPAIGAALMLLFGGLLLTTALRCRLSDSKKGDIERADKRFSRKIYFYNTPNELCPRRTSVFQQENNDIVDAVMKEYGALSHYQPERDHNSNFEQSFALNLSRPEMVDKGVSPIDEDRLDCEHSRSSIAGSNSLTQARKGAELEQKIDISNRRTAVSDERNEPAFSGIDVRSRCSFDDDSLELFSPQQDETKEEQNAHTEDEKSESRPLTKLRSSRSSNNRTVVDEDQGTVPLPLSEKTRSSSSKERRVSLLHRKNSKRAREKAIISKYDHSRPRTSNSQSGSDDSVDIANVSSHDASDAALRPLSNPAGSIIRSNNPLTKENVRRCDARSPMRMFALEKWLSEVQTFYPFHRILREMENSDSDSTESRYAGTKLRKENLRPSEVNVGQERMRKTRTWRRAREMRRPHFNRDLLSPPSLDNSSGSDADVGESSGSCFHRVRRPNSLHCGVNTRLYTRGSGGGQEAKQRSLDRKLSVSEKERLSSPQATCTGGLRCDKGTYRDALCQEEPTGTFNDPSESYQILATRGPDKSHSFIEQQLRRASYFGGAQILAQPERKDCPLRGASSMGEQGSADTKGRDAQYGLVKEQVRGASFFGGTQALAQPEGRDCHLRGASGLGDQGSADTRSRHAHKEQLRGASSFCGTQIFAQSESKDFPLRGASSLGGQETRLTDNSNAELRGASVFGGSQILRQVKKRKPYRTGALGLENDQFQSEISAVETRSAISLQDQEEFTSSITLTVARDSDEENLRCETDSLMSRRSYKTSSAVSVKSSNTVIAAKTSSTGTKEEEREEDVPRDHSNHKRLDSRVIDCRTWRARGRHASCVEAPSVREGSGVSCDDRRTAVRSNKDVRSNSKLSSESILNIGKDASVMSAVLHALRQERDFIRDRRKA